jgi:Domain of unknown function (DUF4148)
MNAKHLFAALAVAITASSTFAGNLDTIYPYVDHSNVVSTKTRADVIAELQQARADGSLSTPDHLYPEVQAQASSVTRAQVREQLAQHLRAQSNGQVNDSLYRGS